MHKGPGRTLIISSEELPSWFPEHWDEYKIDFTDQFKPDKHKDFDTIFVDCRSDDRDIARIVEFNQKSEPGADIIVFDENQTEPEVFEDKGVWVGFLPLIRRHQLPSLYYTYYTYLWFKNHDL